MRGYICGFLAFISVQLTAADIKYPVSAIPAGLKENADAVVREEISVFTINARDRATHFNKKVITVLNAKGKDHATEVVLYDKLRKITSFKGTMYNASGEVVKKLKSNEIYDQSYVDSGTLYDDSRVKVADLSHTSYPYTVEFEYTVEYKFLFHIPSFHLLAEERLSVEKSTYSLVYVPDLAPRYKVFNIKSEPLKNTERDGKESLSWTFENQRPVKFEYYSPSIKELVPTILAAPTVFSFEGYSGRMDTWEGYSAWNISLLKDRDILPDATRQKARELTQGANTLEEKVKALYEYVQGKTRYVGIQLGIGGFQPFEAKVVDKLGYGDCKALTNYMIALLSEVGVKGYYTLIYAGKSKLELAVDFPSTQFNHVFVAVPNGRDTLWLECTSQTNPFGYLGHFTSDRYALMITEDGGKIVKTPTYSAEQNLQSRMAQVRLDIQGNAQAEVKTTYAGLQYENGGLSQVLSDQYDNQKKWILKNTPIPSFDMNRFEIANEKSKVPAAMVNLELTLNRFASVSGKRLFMTPNLMNRLTYVPEKLDKRETDIILNQAFIDVDTITYHIPESIYPEFLPEPVKLTSRFGEYEASFLVDQGKVVYIRKFKMIKGRFPADSYQEFTDFYRNINKADHVKLVFLSKT